MENSIVKHNLMTEEGYTPYCGALFCTKGMPRTNWNSDIEQFICSCGWKSNLPNGFIVRYKRKWNK